LGLRLTRTKPLWVVLQVAKLAVPNWLNQRGAG